jgi:hypothetical protein
MRKFVITIVVFSLLSCLAGEIIIRVFKLTTEVPYTFVDPKSGLHLYIPGQSGYYAKAKQKWHVNQYGWLGIANTEKSPLFSIIGDSYIENIMNPIACNQGAVLQSLFKDYGFFEAGRSGVTFIEALEITKMLDAEIDPLCHFIYLKNSDFNESLLSKGRYSDRVQLDLEKDTILLAKLKSPLARKILYSSKLLYYFYLRFPLFVSKQNKGGLEMELGKNQASFDRPTFAQLFEYCSKHYKREKIIFVFHPGTDQGFVNLAQEAGFKTLLLNPKGDKSWSLKHDDHWSCYGHKRVALQVQRYIIELIKQDVQGE